MAQATASSSSVMSNAPNKFQYLGLCLIDALEDENLHTLEMLLKKHMSNPNVIVEAKGYAAVHLVCGLENRSFSLEAAKMIFDESGGDPNIPTFECMVTPMHIAAANGNAQVFQLMLKHGGNIEAEDTEGATPLVYAVREKYHYDVVMIAQNFLTEQKVERKRREAEERRFLSPAVHNRITMTPQGVPANFDPTSPFYINITHRRKTPGKIPSISVTPSEMEDKENTPVTPKKVNLFELTQTNLEEYSRLFTRSSTTKESFIDSWRAKVTMSSSRGSLTRNIEVMEKILFSFDDTTDESFHTTNTSAFFTANSGDASTDDSQLIRRSPRNSQGSSVQLMEGFKHQDADNEISFYELRFHPLKPDAAPKSDGDSNSSTSTVLQLATDYDTDVLRADLTAFGTPPGPITKTTKKLYVKKLREYKAQPQLAEVAMQKWNNVPNFSVELINSLPMRDFNIHLVQYLKLEQDMMQDIRGSTKKWREGNLKTSFIYFLIDPRISQNLPAAVSQMSIEDVWMRFLQSIFYVGKGKSSRPYAHLYDAIKQFEVCYLNNGGERGDAGSRKFNRIMDIWDADMGVVCLHVFHSIIPVEAYTREAAIIDCLGLQHLTNLKRGDYYGITSSWPMRMKKHMGIALLFKALQVFLAEGETQVSPRDLL